MKTTELNGTEYKLTEGDGGKITLTPLNKQPEAGDVWDIDGHDLRPTLVTISGYSHLSNGVSYNSHDAHDNLLERKGVYLGKFDEVYAKISDIRAALSHKDFHGDSILNSTVCSVTVTGLERSRKALRKLNIITD
mgnify:CR=1 FL=1